MDLINTYFFTATILKWTPILKDDKMKDILLQSLEFLISKKKLRVYGFVIMPNHIHFIWRNIEMNGKEFPNESFMKFTGHQLRKEIYKIDIFKVDKVDRKYQIWQRNSLPVKIFSRQMLEQKLNYIHLNPLQQHWDIVKYPSDYKYSSSAFYEYADKKFEWLVDYREDYS